MTQHDWEEPDLVEDALEARLRSDDESDRDRRRYMLVVALRCLGWCALGLLCIGWSAHTTSMSLGRIAFWFGLMAGNGGILFTLAAAYLHGERRGYW